MDSLKLKVKDKKVAEISYEDKKELVVVSEDENFKKKIESVVNNFSKGGIKAFLEPEKREPNKIKIIGKLIFPEHPKFLIFLGKEFKNLGYQLVYVTDKKYFQKKTLENGIRKKLDSLEVDDEGNQMIKEILKVIPKMSLDQLKTVEKELK